MTLPLVLAAWVAQVIPPPPTPPHPSAPPPAPQSQSQSQSQSGDVAHRPARRPDLDAVLLRAAGADDPPVEALRRAASALAAVEPERAHALLGRARWAAWLPEVRLRVERRFGRTESVDLGSSQADPLAIPVGVDTINDLRYEARATWDLSRIVFNPDEIAAGSQALRMADTRREVESVVIRLYFERRRLKAEGLASDANDMASRFRLDLRVQEIEAELDALTAGAFSRLRAARGGDPSAAAP